MAVETWKRTLHLDGPHHWVLWHDTVPQFRKSGTTFIDSNQTTTSERGYRWDQYRRLVRAGIIDPRTQSPGDYGNEFYTHKRSYRDNGRYRTFPKSGQYQFTGKLYPWQDVVFDNSSGQTHFPSYPSILDLEMIGAGTIAINSTSPSNPSVDLSQALIELIRDRPQIPLRGFLKRPNLGEAGSEYLNLVFGIQPTISDFQDAVETVRNSDKIIRDFKRNSGRPLRRRFEFPEIVTSTTEEFSNRLPKPNFASNKVGIPSLTLTKETITKRKYWFSGCFTYFLSPGNSPEERLLRQVQLANKLYGVRFSPDLVWSLSPYSWLADWYGTIGDVLENVTDNALYGQVLRYGYVMATSEITWKYTLPTAPYLGYDLEQEFTSTVKRRMKATPYGFGLNPSSFSEKQWAILAALGLSRGYKVLN